MKGPSGFFNSFRFNLFVTSFFNLQAESIVSFRMHHGDINPPTDPVSTIDIIGPIDKYGNPTIGSNGEWKRFESEYGIDVRSMGFRTYSVSYIGLKKYVRLSHSILNAPPIPGAWITSWVSLMRMSVHVRKCYNRYLIEGSEGGQ